MNDQSDHPAVVRLRAELDAAWKGVGALAQLEGISRDRVVAELRAAVPDVAGRAAREAGREAVVAEIRRFADAEVVASDPTVPTRVIWGDIVGTATVAATATTTLA
ncbi:hypothetical protein BIU98_17435 [Curtobacterium sp. MMLR14_010]|jgi:hypothetical protein|uniref:hypothetical protein n=1 Tax=Curtobacterium sp. MMLR14_010 TaxID=1898743 RepID=UPI0008DE8C24|nr:hypothetical protein [Curtobacterium sp. MMLR14_010]OII36459.1 hypothetical protein BIU98_17435 [Curtobacterium sp. MMLR14_010]